MLVITRSQGESFFVGDDVEIIISSVGSNKVKISIDAPKNIKIMRKELIEIKNLNEDAAREVDKTTIDMLAKHIKK